VRGLSDGVLISRAGGDDADRSQFRRHGKCYRHAGGRLAPLKHFSKTAKSASSTSPSRSKSAASQAGPTGVRAWPL